MRAFLLVGMVGVSLGVAFACGSSNDSKNPRGSSTLGGESSGGSSGEPGTSGDGGLGPSASGGGGAGEAPASNAGQGGVGGGATPSGGAGAGGEALGGVGGAAGGAAGAGGAGGSDAAPVEVDVVIANFDFETPALADNTFTSNVVSDWVGTDSGDVNNFGVFNPPVAYFTGQAPAGQNVAYIERGGIHQTLALNLEAGTTYTLAAKLGDSLQDPTPGYSLELRAGATTLAAVSSVALVNDGFVDVSLSYVGKVADPVGTALEIWIVESTQDKSSELFIDSVTFKASK